MGGNGDMVKERWVGGILFGALSSSPLTWGAGGRVQLGEVGMVQQGKKMSPKQE